MMPLRKSIPAFFVFLDQRPLCQPSSPLSPLCHRSGINELMTEQATLMEGGPVFVSMCHFNNDVVWLADDFVPLAEVEHLSRATYIPSGCTALCDAIMEGIHRTKVALAGESRDVHFVIQTDGHENASLSHDEEDVRCALKVAQEEDGWNVHFLNADLDNVASAASIGVDPSCSLRYSNARGSGGTSSAFRMASLRIAASRSASTW
jgi:hypothetical protein